MGGLTAVLSLALATHAVSVDKLPLRDGCDAGEPVLAELQKGDPVEIRFRLAGGDGACLKVNVESGGEKLQGYIAAEGITGMAEFDRGLQAAPTAQIPSTIRADAAAIEQAALARGSSDQGSRAAELIQANRPREALRILEPLVRAQGQDAGLLSLAGYAAYRADDMRLAKDYLSRSLALRPSNSVRRVFDIVDRESREDQSGEKLVGSRFMLRFNRDEMSSRTAREIIGALEQEWSRISQQLGCRVDERVVAIVQTPEEYRKTTDAAEWSAGRYNGRIRVAANDQTRFDARTRQIFAHELVHACMHGLGNYPVWLHEGLAQKLSGETLGSREKAMVEQMARAKKLPKLDNLSQTWSRMSTSHAQVAYATALYAVELFYQHHGGIGPRNLLRNPGILRQVQVDLDNRLGRVEVSRR
jgi:putative lipoic acid-binding regulatory protein